MQDFGLSKVQAIAWAKPKLARLLYFKQAAAKQLFQVTRSIRLKRRDPVLSNYKPILLAMKLTAIILLTACLQVSAKGYAQNVTLTLKDAPLQTVFEQVEKQTNYRFVFTWETLKKSKPVNITVKNVTIAKVLELCFKDQPLTYQLDDKIIVVKEKAASVVSIATDPAPELPFIDVKGRVVNEKGEPVAGVTVTIKGSKTATTTNANGEFTLASIEQNAVLIFSHVSLETFELNVRGKTELAISLRTKVSALGDVTVTVNTGYQQIPKERATGSFEYINTEELNRRVGTDILSRLEGVSPSVLFDRRKLSPTQNSVVPGNIIIRGLSTLTESMKAPLIILNNFPFDGDLNDINPNDIESITILKDAAAASIWGARAGNGVIVLSTKQGKYYQPLKISLNSNITIGEKPDLFYYPRLNSSEFINIETFLFDKGFYNADINNTSTRPAVTPVVEILVRKKAGLITEADANSQIDIFRESDVRNDFDKYVYRSAINQQYALNLNGGSQNTRYSLSGGYDKNLANLNGDSYDRFTLRSDNTIKVNKDLELTLGLMLTSSKNANNSIGHYGSTAYNYRQNKALYPYAQLADSDGNPLAIAKDYRLQYADTAGAGLLLDWKYKPLQELKFINNPTDQQDVVINLGITYRLLNSLEVQMTGQYSKIDQSRNTLFSHESYFTRNLINLYSQIAGNSVKYLVPNDAIIDNFQSRFKSLYGRAQLNFNKNINGRHELNVIGGSEIRERNQSSNLQRTYGYNPDNLTIASIDYLNQYPLYGNRGLSRIPQIASFTKTIDRFISFFTNASYTFNKKYTFSFSGRSDASNLFGVDVNNKWKPLWTIGGSWNISNELFYNIKFMPYLKARVTYGFQGNVNNSLSPYAILSYISANFSIINEPSASIRTPANNDLSWESIRQINAGLDFRLFSDRLSGSVDIYKKVADDLILEATTDPTTGIRSVKTNSAKIQAKGMEVSLTSLNIKMPFIWRTEIGLGVVQNKVLDNLLNNNTTSAQSIVNSGANIRSHIGQSPYPVISYPFAGLDPQNGDPLGYIGKNTSNDYRTIFNQRYDTAALVYHGSAVPTVFGYLNNTFSYKKISLAISISYKLGYYFRRNSISYFALFQNGISHIDYRNRWQNPGDENTTSIPSMVYPASNSRRDDFYANSTVTVLKGDHFRLQFLRLSYDFDRSGYKKLPVKSFKVFVIANNLGILWRANKQKLDPDFDLGNAAFSQPRSFAVGLTANF